MYSNTYSYFNLLCRIKASSLLDKTEGEYGILINNNLLSAKLIMSRPYSEDLRWRAIWMKEILGCQVDEVAAALWMWRTLEALIRQRKLK